MSPTKRAAAAGFLLSVAGLASWFAAVALRPDPLPVGAALPPLMFDGGAGPHRLMANGQTPLLIVWFRSECIHCQYEFGVLDRNLDLLPRVQIYLLTGADSLPHAQLAESWPALELPIARNASWPALGAPGRATLASVPSSEFERAFGTRVTPAMFAFDSRGKLIAKVIGETKFDRIAAAFHTQRVAGPGPRASATP